MTLLIKTPIEKINRKRQFLKLCLIIFLTVIMLLGSAKAFAAEKTCSLTVKITSSDNAASQSALSVGLCKIASLQNGKYELTDAFSDSGISIESISKNINSNHNAEIYRYITENNIPHQTATTNSKNSAVFSNLGKGIYLVFCEQSQNLTFSPYIVFLPSVANGNITYNVTSEPKTIITENNVKSIYVKIIWDDNNNYAGKRPNTVTVTLLKDGKPYRTVEISEECNWEYTFKDVPADGIYTIRQDKVDNYGIYYEGDAENGFTITNTLITESPIMNFVKTGIDTGIFPIAFLILISAVVMIILSRKQTKR